jgi:hypothetical protein
VTILQGAKQSAEAEREGDKTGAMREYQAEKLASQANMRGCARYALRRKAPIRNRWKYRVRQSGE